MKKFLLIIALLISALGLNAQTPLMEDVEILLSEDFENYEVGAKIAETNPEYWTTWNGKPGSNEDGIVAELDGNKYGYLTYGNDQVLLLGGYQAGVYELEFDMYIPEGKEAYYNLLHEFNGSNSQWALQAYLQKTDDGQGNYTISAGHGTIHAGGNGVADIPCVYDGWMHFRVVIDANSGKAEYYYTMPDSEEVKGFDWQWFYDSFANSVVSCKLDAMCFFPPISESEFYIDNIILKKIGDATALNIITGVEPGTYAGIVTGAGAYEEGDMVTLIATPNTGFVFTGWEENGEIVSTDAEYTFAVTKERIIVAVFENECSYVITNNSPAECQVSDCSSYLINVIIPSTVTISGKEYTVTSIGSSAFYNCSSLTSIEIPSGVTSIGERAFYDCSGLTSVTFGENSQLTSIGYEAFSGCSSLTSIELPSGVTSIVEWAFSGCSSLTSIEIPSSVTSIGNYSFANCSSLTSIEIPSSVTSIGDNPFVFCPSLTSIIVESGNTVYDSRDNCNAIIETATNTLIAGCQSTVIPNTVTSIGNYAFDGCSKLTSIEIPSSVTSIGGVVFWYCSSLTSIEIPSSVTSIGDNPFVFCPSLTSIVVESGNTVYDSRDNCNAIIEIATNILIAGCQSTVIPNTVTSIGNYAFESCTSLTSIEIPSGVTSIGAGAFSWCSSLTSIEFEENSQLTSIGENAFDGCSSLTSIEIPSGVTSIGVGAFSGCSSLTSIEIPSGVTSIGNFAFDGCSKLKSIEIPSSVTSIGVGAFSGCSSLTSIEIPSGVTSIGNYAFDGCSKLTSIEIPSGVTFIGAGAFYGCSSLTSISCHAESVPETGSNAFDDCPSDMVIYVPEQSVDAYKAASPWNNYTIMPLTDNEDPETPDGNDPEQPTDSVVLVAPALAVDTVTETTVVLVWNAIDSATSYNVYMDSVLVKNVTDTIYTVDSLISDSTYNFMVTAVADTLESEFSNAVTVTTLKAEGEEPEQPENPEEPGDEPEEPIELDTPENVEATAISTSSIIITWDKVENALSYNIYRDGELLDDTENTNYTDKDLEYNTEYCYTVEAVNGKETSDESEEVCVKTLGEGVEEHETSFNIYPNPVSDKLYIETLTQTLTQTQTQTVEIYDAFGRLQSTVNGQQSMVDVSNLNSGVYFVKVVTNEGDVVKRFVKK